MLDCTALPHLVDERFDNGKVVAGQKAVYILSLSHHELLFMCKFSRILFFMQEIYP